MLLLYEEFLSRNMMCHTLTNPLCANNAITRCNWSPQGDSATGRVKSNLKGHKNLRDELCIVVLPCGADVLPPVFKEIIRLAWLMLRYLSSFKSVEPTTQTRFMVKIVFAMKAVYTKESWCEGQRSTPCMILWCSRSDVSLMHHVDGLQLIR